MSALPSVKGWCPSGLWLMQTGDGWLMRLRPDAGALSAAQAHLIAALARRCGNGLIDLTSHANVQLRGIDVGKIDVLRETLTDAGLLRDSVPDDRGSIVMSPLAGCDRAASIDIRPIAAALRTALAQDPLLEGLPDKFTVVVEDDGLFDLAAQSADMRFTAFQHDGETRFAVRIAGLNGEIVLGHCSLDNVVETASSLAQRFLQRRGDGADRPRRMRDLVVRLGAAAFLDHLHRRELPPAAARVFPSCGGRIAAAAGCIGSFGSDVVGVAAPFGRLDADQLAAIADLGTTIHPTPWRALLVSGIRHDVATTMTALARQGFITHPDDPRLRIAACPGAPHCDCGSTPTQADAATLAAALPPGLTLHVSGCAKGCARATSAPVTLVGRDGRAGDTPIRYGLTIAAAADELRRLGAAA